MKRFCTGGPNGPRAEEVPKGGKASCKPPRQEAVGERREEGEEEGGGGRKEERSGRGKQKRKHYKGVRKTT